MTERQKESRVVGGRAFCLTRGCLWRAHGSGSIGHAAKHHDETGHKVQASQTLEVRYG